MEPTFNTQPNNNQVRRNLVLAALSLALIIFLVWIYGYIHTAQVFITTKNPYSTITLTPSSNGLTVNGAKTYKGTGKLSQKVHTGQYIATVDGNSAAASQAVTLKSRQVLHLTINPIDPSAVEPVTYDNASDIVADSGQLEYLNSNSSTLHKIDSQNRLSTLDSSGHLQNIRWSSTSFGIGQDSGNHLYTISNGSVATLKVPFSYDNSSVSFGISPGGQVYVSHGKDVFKGNQSGNFKKIYTSDGSSPLLAVGAKDIAVTTDSSTKDGSEQSLVTIINSSGSVIAKNNIDSAAIIWSPDDRYLVAVSESQGASIYATSLKKVTTIPNTSGALIDDLAWLDDNTLFFPINDQLWEYDLPAQKAEVMANMPLANFINGVSLSSDKAYIYLSTIDSNTGSDAAIRRVGLKDQAAPDIAFQLQDILPKTLNDCTLNLVNFSGQRPTVLAVQLPDSFAGYVNEAQSELQQDGIDLSKLNLQGRPAPEDSAQY